MTGSRAAALARLDGLVGEWAMEARFPGHHGGGWEHDFALTYRRTG